MALLSNWHEASEGVIMAKTITQIEQAIAQSNAAVKSIVEDIHEAFEADPEFTVSQLVGSWIHDKYTFLAKLAKSDTNFAEKLRSIAGLINKANGTE